jgi:hypothetical protein
MRSWQHTSKSTSVMTIMSSDSALCNMCSWNNVNTLWIYLLWDKHKKTVYLLVHRYFNKTVTECMNQWYCISAQYGNMCYSLPDILVCICFSEMLLDESRCIYRRTYANKKSHTHRWKNVPFPTINLKVIQKVIKHFTICDSHVIRWLNGYTK